MLELHDPEGAFDRLEQCLAGEGFWGRRGAVAEGRVHLWVGGGTDRDSDPEAEIEESWVKARPLLSAVGSLVRA